MLGYRNNVRSMFVQCSLETLRLFCALFVAYLWPICGLFVAYLCCCHFTHFQALALLGSSAIVDIVRDRVGDSAIAAIARLLASLIKTLFALFEERIERREVERKVILNIFVAV